MSGVPQVFIKNALSMLAVRILTPLSALLLFIYASRAYSVEAIGKYSLLLAFYQMFQYFALLGLTPYLTKEVSKNRSLAGKYILHMCWIALPVSLLLNFALYGTGVLLNYPTDVMQGLVCLGFLVTIGTAAVIYETIFVAYEKIHLIAAVVLIETVLRLAASVWLIKNGYNFVFLILVMAVSRFFATCVYVLIANRVRGGAAGVRVDISFIKELLGICRIFFAISICSTLINRVDFLLLSKLRSFEEVGLYTAGYRLLDICVLLNSTLIFVFFPTLSRLYHVSAKETVAATKKFVKYLSVLMMFLVSFIFTFAEPLIRLFYPASYAVSADVLKVLIFTAFFLGLDQALAGLFIISDHQRLDLKVLIIGIFIYLVLLSVLIPAFGFYGAAAATVLAMACQFTVRCFYFKKHVFQIHLPTLVWKPVLAGLTTILAMELLGAWYWLWLVPLSVCFYILTLFILGVFEKEDLRYILGLKLKEVSG